MFTSTKFLTKCPSGLVADEVNFTACVLARKVPVAIFFTHLFQSEDVHAHLPWVPCMVQVILVGEEAGYMMSEQLYILFMELTII